MTFRRIASSEADPLRVVVAGAGDRHSALMSGRGAGAHGEAAGAAGEVPAAGEAAGAALGHRLASGETAGAAAEGEGDWANAAWLPIFDSTIHRNSKGHGANRAGM